MAALDRQLTLTTCTKHLLLLEKLAPDALLRCLHETIDAVCGRKGDNDHKMLEGYTTESEWADLSASLKLLVCEAAKNNWSKDEISNILKQLDPSIIQLIHTSVVVRREELHQHLLDRTCEVSQNSLKDFDWKVKLVLGSDKMGTIREPLVSLSLDLEGCTNRNLTAELNKDDLTKLIHTLEGMNKTLTQLKA